jgi:hypothetical protein
MQFAVAPKISIYVKKNAIEAVDVALPKDSEYSPGL